MVIKMAQAEVDGELLHCQHCSRITRMDFSGGPAHIEVSKEELLEHMTLDEQYGQPEPDFGPRRVYFHRSGICEDCMAGKFS